MAASSIPSLVLSPRALYVMRLRMTRRRRKRNVDGREARGGGGGRPSLYRKRVCSRGCVVGDHGAEEPRLCVHVCVEKNIVMTEAVAG